MTSPGIDRAALVELAMDPDVGPARLRSAAAGHHHSNRSVQEVLFRSDRHDARGEPPRRPDGGPQEELAVVRRLAASGVGVTVVGDDEHPSDTPEDPHVPPVLFWMGRRGLGAGPRVGIVGTRRASRYGLDIAVGLGRSLSLAGVGVVSGLALGIDAAAHRGCLDGPRPLPVAVVGCGVDVVYPRRHRHLWDQVRAQGSIVSEYPPGVNPAPWRFPARNRILAACCDALVVVESAETGGSLITAGIAAERGVPVLAVPGSIHSERSMGCNRLLADGAAPMIDVRDVLDAVGVDAVGLDAIEAHRASDPSTLAVPAAATATAAAPPSSGVEGDVWTALDDGAVSLDTLSDRCDASAAEIFGAVSVLEARGLVWVDESGIRRRHV